MLFLYKALLGERGFLILAGGDGCWTGPCGGRAGVCVEGPSDTLMVRLAAGGGQLFLRGVKNLGLAKSLASN